MIRQDASGLLGARILDADAALTRPSAMRRLRDLRESIRDVEQHLHEAEAGARHAWPDSLADQARARRLSQDLHDLRRYVVAFRRHHRL